MGIGIELDLAERGSFTLGVRDGQPQPADAAALVQSVDAERPPLIVRGRLLQILPVLAILAGLPDVLHRGIAQGELMITVNLEYRPDVAGLGKLDLPPP